MVFIIFFEDQRTQMALFVDHGQAILFVAMQKPIGLSKRNTFNAKNYLCFRRHVVFYEVLKIIFKFPEILIGNQTQKFTFGRPVPVGL